MITEHAGIDGVHLLEFLHVDQKDTATDHILQVGSAGLQDRLQVLEALLGLGRDVSAGQLPGRGIGRTLARYENEALETHARRIRAYWFRKVLGVNRFVAHGATIIR